jgi:hypothetical protein
MKETADVLPFIYRPSDLRRRALDLRCSRAWPRYRFSRSAAGDRSCGGHGPATFSASAEVLEQTVAAPLENQINGVEDMLYMSSTSSSNGAVEINITFEIGTDVDQATVNVNNRVRQAEARLPQEVRRQGVTGPLLSRLPTTRNS